MAKSSYLQKVSAEKNLAAANRGHVEVSKPLVGKNMTIIIAERQIQVAGCGQWELEWFV